MMLDPHVRAALLLIEGKPGLYRAVFRIPDRHSVFKFALEYRHRGWMTLKVDTTVPSPYLVTTDIHAS